MKKSARRQAYIAKKEKRNKKKFPLFKFLIPLAIVVLIFLFFKLSTRYWNGVDKVSVVFLKENGDVAVSVADPRLSEITTLVIPGDTQVNVARNYGTFRIKNVWQLGMDEKLGGSLLSETVTKNFLFPVILWNGKETGFDDGNFGKLFGFVFAPGKTNIPMGDRVKIAYFAIRVQNLGRTNIDLGKSKFLDKKKLADGQSGYIIGGPVSERLTAYFSDNQMNDQNIKVNITDATGYPGISEKLGEILQVVGGKVVSIDKRTTAEDIDCFVAGKNSVAVKKIAGLFSCKISGNQTTFDLDIKIGKQFAKRF